MIDILNKGAEIRSKNEKISELFKTMNKSDASGNNFKNILAQMRKFSEKEIKNKENLMKDFFNENLRSFKNLKNSDKIGQLIKVKSEGRSIKKNFDSSNNEIKNRALPFKKCQRSIFKGKFGEGTVNRSISAPNLASQNSISSIYNLNKAIDFKESFLFKKNKRIRKELFKNKKKRKKITPLHYGG